VCLFPLRVWGFSQGVEVTTGREIERLRDGLSPLLVRVPSHQEREGEREREREVDRLSDGLSPLLVRELRALSPRK
jgi:hypothetical protein